MIFVKAAPKHIFVSSLRHQITLQIYEREEKENKRVMFITMNSLTAYDMSTHFVRFLKLGWHRFFT